MIREPAARKISLALIALAVLMLIGSAFRSYRVDDPLAEDMEDLGVPVFLRVSERQMTVDATFHGVDRLDGRLVSTYDRLAGGKKRPCPT